MQTSVDYSSFRGARLALTTAWAFSIVPLWNGLPEEVEGPSLKIFWRSCNACLFAFKGKHPGPVCPYRQTRQQPRVLATSGHQRHPFPSRLPFKQGGEGWSPLPSHTAWSFLVAVESKEEALPCSWKSSLMGNCWCKMPAGLHHCLELPSSIQRQGGRPFLLPSFRMPLRPSVWHVKREDLAPHWAVLPLRQTA